MTSRNKNLIFTAVAVVLSVGVGLAQPYAYTANISGNSVSVVNTANNTVAATVSVPTSPSGVAVTPDGTRVYVACQGANTVAVISTATNTLTTTIPVGTTPVQLAISPNGAQVYVVIRGQNQVAVIDTASNTVSATIGVGNRPVAVAFNLSGSQAYVPNLYSGNVSVIDTASKTVVNTFTAASGPSAVTVTPANFIYVSNQYSNAVTVHDMSGNKLTTISGFSFPNWLTSTPNGSRVFVSNGNSSSAGVIDTSSNTLMATVATGSNPTSVAVSSDGTMAYVVNEYAFTLSSVSVATNAVMNTIAHVGVYPIAVATVPSGNQPPPQCTYSLSANSASFSASGGTGTVNVTAGAGCAWTAGSNVNWAGITGGASGSGNGTVSFSVNPNGTANVLSGTLTIAGQTFTITEAGVACSYSLSANSASFGSGGGPGSVNVTAPVGCAWSAVSNVGWVSVSSGANGNGSGTVSYSVTANNTASNLSGTMTIAGQTYTVNEAGVSCSYSLSTSSASFNSTGGTGSVNVTAPAGCSWTAVSNAGFVHVTGGASGSGNGTVNYSVDANGGVNPVSGTMTIATQTFTVNESGIACSYSLSGSSISLGAGAGGGSVNVLTSAGCGWTGSSDSTSWLTITAGSAGTGNGTVSFAVTANPGTASRTGNLTIGGQNFAVTQAGASFSAIRVRCGGPQYTDGSGNVWSPDNSANYSVTNAAIAGTATPALYQTESWSNSTLQYQFTVPNGSFTVKLHFVEFYMKNPGQRTFNIVVNGTAYYSSYDILGHVAVNTADDVSIPVVVNNGQVTIQLIPVTGPATVSAIEIF